MTQSTCANYGVNLGVDIDIANGKTTILVSSAEHSANQGHLFVQNTD